jgi:hypothetical protein
MEDETTVATRETALVPIVPGVPAPADLLREGAEPPALVVHGGPGAAFVWDEFFAGEIRNPHTRAAYERAVRAFTIG